MAFHTPVRPNFECRFAVIGDDDAFARGFDLTEKLKLKSLALNSDFDT
jgi:hypothetical protein